MVERAGLLTIAATVALALAGAGRAEGPTTQAERVQAALDGWLAERGPVEGVTGIAAYVSLATPGPNIEAFAGRTGRGADDPPVDQNTLFAMGSTSKSFAAAVILLLEARGFLSIDDTVGKWLPQYPAWGDVSIRRLLDMTSGIPNYSETEFISRVWVEQPKRDLSAEELVAAVYPSAEDHYPATEGYSYSNTNYILAAMIAAKAAGKPYADLVRELILEPQGLHSTFYTPGTYPAEVIARLAHGYFENSACAGYQPADCKETWNKPLIGQDVREDSTSWAQAAGGAISNARDVSRWMRAVFEGRVVPPKQQAEWLSMVSTKTGQPIAEVSADDPMGFSLGLAQALMPVGKVWFYQGETLGYRTLYVWFEADDVMVTVQTNSQPNDDANELHDAATAIHAALREP
ncbi:MAG: serine hydrolase domain-containing protein [Amaricoccus sp.]